MTTRPRPSEPSDHRGLALSEIPLRKIPFKTRAEPKPPASAPARRARQTPRARRWPWVAAGVLGALMFAPLAAHQLTGYQMPPLAGFAPTTLPSVDQLLKRVLEIARTVSSTAPKPESAPTRPLALAAVDPVLTMAPAATALTPEVPALVVAPAAMPSPASMTNVARREAVPDNPAAVCAPRTNFALYRCMQLECEQSRYYAHSQCVRLRLHDELPS